VAWRSEASTAGGRRFRYAAEAMLLLADTALGQTLALLVTFLGVGVLVNILVLYIVAQVLGERKQNREYRAGHDGL